MFIIDFAVVKTNAELTKLTKEMTLYTDNKPFILAMEDLDKTEMIRYRHSEGVSLQGLINAIDGLVESHGRVLFMTANEAERIRNYDPSGALMRSGRIDEQVEIGLCDFDQLQRILLHYYGPNHECIQQLEESDMKREFSPAEVQKLFQRYGNHGRADPTLLIRRLFNGVERGDDEEDDEEDGEAENTQAQKIMTQWERSNRRGRKLQHDLRWARKKLKTATQENNDREIVFANLEKNKRTWEERVAKIVKQVSGWTNRNKTIQKKIKNLNGPKPVIKKKRKARARA